VRNTVLQNRLVTRQVGNNIFNNNIFRSEWNYQFTRRLSLRTIGQYSNVLPSSDLSSLTIRKTLSGDFLFAYLVHPGTALYVGYNNLLQNYDRNVLVAEQMLVPSRSDLLSTGATFFVKVSYQLKF